LDRCWVRRNGEGGVMGDFVKVVMRGRVKDIFGVKWQSLR
jgi:hypothetical protein